MPGMPLTPAVEAFGDLLEPEVAKGKIIVDPNRFVADPARTGRIPELPYLTVRLGYVACGHFQADLGTATVRKEHQAFYRRVFLQDVLCEPRPYPSLTKPLSLMAAHYPSVRDRIFRRYPYFRSTMEERQRLFRTGAGRRRRLAPATTPSIRSRCNPIIPVTENRPAHTVRRPAGLFALVSLRLVANACLPCQTSTVAPHLLAINHNGRFNSFPGI